MIQMKTTPSPSIEDQGLVSPPPSSHQEFLDQFASMQSKPDVVQLPAAKAAWTSTDISTFFQQKRHEAAMAVPDKVKRLGEDYLKRRAELNEKMFQHHEEKMKEHHPALRNCSPDTLRQLATMRHGLMLDQIKSNRSDKEQAAVLDKFDAHFSKTENLKVLDESVNQRMNEALEKSMTVVVRDKSPYLGD